MVRAQSRRERRGAGRAGRLTRTQQEVVAASLTSMRPSLSLERRTLRSQRWSAAACRAGKEGVAWERLASRSASPAASWLPFSSCVTACPAANVLEVRINTAYDALLSTSLSSVRLLWSCPPVHWWWAVGGVVVTIQPKPELCNTIESVQRAFAVY